MSISRDILASYRDPGPVLQRRAGAPSREYRTLGLVLLACLLMFVARAPVEARVAFYDSSVPIAARLYWSALFFLFILPLLLYPVAALSHLLVAGLGGHGSWFTARLALFWALLAAAPLWLLSGLVAALIGPGPQMNAVGVLALAGFLMLWLRGLWALEFPGTSAP